MSDRASHDQILHYLRQVRNRKITTNEAARGRRLRDSVACRVRDIPRPCRSTGRKDFVGAKGSPTERGMGTVRSKASNAASLVGRGGVGGYLEARR